ncbi:amidase [Nocardia wallacei]|uniref:Glutamyl-tRNA(Gln) amidotransferase subunit A n=1 Tax=Nocardia wallacei TaxID=480035 RepID=A0A7G1KF73_9NOCA|nr:amidase [Nocardia wallacei]BCK53600.1 glutamyl-tRNA(Gln) amidotransferase subunit A [Nocardia wallacei]
MSRKHFTLCEAAAAIRSGAVCSTELVEDALAAADRWDDPLGIYVTRTDDLALAAAERADRELAAGHDRGPLHGIPFGVKDLIAVAGVPTTAQSLVRQRERAPERHAEVVERLLAAGAVITGKTTTTEFGCGLPDPAKPFPVPRNPWDPRRWAGGSSSGSAAGVAAGVFSAGLGTDTAGSIRVPAAFCGVTGLAPTFGLVPTNGCVPLGYSLDRVGPLAHGARDCAAVLDVLAGVDPDTFRPPDPDTGLAGLRIGVVREHHLPSTADPALPAVFERAVAVLAELGAAVTEVVLPFWIEAVTATMVVASVEGLAQHRIDLAGHWEDYTSAARSLLANGAMIGGADYVQAQRVRSRVHDAVTELFTTVDVVVSPTAAAAAPLLAALTDESGHQDNDAAYGAAFTPYWNCVANPVLSMPMGHNAAGLPLAMQIAAPCFADATALRVAAAFQDHTEWHRPRAVGSPFPTSSEARA